MVALVQFREKQRRPEMIVTKPAGISVLTAVCPPLPGEGRSLYRQLERLERRLLRAGATRIILPAELAGKAWTTALRPVEVLPFCRWAAEPLILGWLAVRGVPPEKSCVSLEGARLSPELRATARQLCRRVRRLRIDVPGEEGLLFARTLQRELGLPVQPVGGGQTLRVSFSPPGRGADLCLWGEPPELGGLRLQAEGRELPPELELPLLAVLWERGGLRREELRVTSGVKLSEPLANSGKA